MADSYCTNMDMVLHYRPHQRDLVKLQKLAEAAVKEFPIRQLPRFTPWFPNNLNRLPLKPKKRPPVVSCEEAEELKQLSTPSEYVTESSDYDCTKYLLEFQSSMKHGQALVKEQTVRTSVNLENQGELPANGKQKLKRSWSVSLPSPKLKEEILPLSQELQTNLERLKLHAFYRAKWIIEQSNCNNQNLEEIWIKLNRLIKQNELPSCNATIQRSVGQIWIFCDILYCEYVRNILRNKLSLTDKMNLLVNKFGVIFSL
ncbi:shieldin complex subunit 3 isoform X6 [Falco biarmicus]|nr:shieldin complex subunit 3 [Falco rusticolus]XP_037229423.1 shieldin complex subunit 3 [Falco rusticolus]XP_037229424.1 shieldin complex subunit 3 [Falco rusticolus]XP_055555046.1 shieldin complex subunit 3 [Falco cherrug]XP_055646669.1 shieldin complex subunit 3 [Falco peregrinus]XP_056180365.1 shieldin complex subunit 3 isoform X6 [Falco biarmicus]XP_056180366.1 shieldin complex subunit 3 isoform X6 [Falco biarmicus]XP_056180367.1 shieldin complex subunit 3 isoform X6 [Falco biarmicus]